MRKKLKSLVLLGAAIVATAESALATPPQGFELNDRTGAVRLIRCQ